MYLLGDTHYPRGRREKFRKVLYEIKRKPNAYLLGLGDWVEAISQSDPRYDPEEMAQIISKYGHEMNMIDEQWGMFEDDIAPLAAKGKVIGLHGGNHGAAWKRRSSYNELKKICRRLDVEFLTDGMAVTNISGKDGKTLMLSFHGTGAGTTTGSTYNQLEKYGSIVSNVDIIAAGHCFSEDTEILTMNGWKKHNEINKGTMVMTYNLNNGNSEWNPISELYKYDHYKKLIHFKNRSMDLLVTPDHSVVSTWRFGKAPFARTKAKDVVGKRVDMPNAGSNPNSDYEKYSDDELKLIAWVLTEGCYEDGTYIRISQSDKPKVGTKRITDICERLNVVYSLRERSGNENRNYPAFRISLKNQENDKTLQKIKQNFPDKKLTTELMMLSKRQFDIFFHELILGDGCKLYKRDYQYASKYESDADIFQMLCAQNGFRTSKTYHDNVYYISINTRGVTSVSPETAKYVDYDGLVWCPSVDNQTVVVRRNGKVIVSGNTHKLGVNVSASRLKLIDGKLQDKVQYHCSCGSFLGNYEDGVASYSERKAYTPLPMGYVKVTLVNGVIPNAGVSAIPV